jgi:GTP cyclohydrolase I
MHYNTDADKGDLVHQMLMDKGLETPFKQKEINRDKVQDLFTQIMEEVGIDLEDDSMAETPIRLAKLYSTKEFFRGLDYSLFPKATVVDNKMKYDEMVLERNITVNSLCEHHWLPVVGSAHVAYIPKKKVLGLSKLNRIVEFFARRPQIQERLTAQICATLQFLLETEDVAVCIDAEHLCVKTRGVEDACSDTVTSKLGGVFKSNASTRAEFFNMINVNRT